MIGAVPTGSTLALTAERVVRPATCRSPARRSRRRSSPARRLLLAQHPSWTPDQVKGALMVSATPEPQWLAGSLGVGEVNLAVARHGSRTRRTRTRPRPVPHQRLRTARTVFDAPRGRPRHGQRRVGGAAWSARPGAAQPGRARPGAARLERAAWASAAWGTAAWNGAAWTDAAWADAAWADNAGPPVAHGRLATPGAVGGHCTRGRGCPRPHQPSVRSAR